MTWPLYGFLGLVVAVIAGLPLMAARLRERRLHEAGLDDPERITDEEMLRHMTGLMEALGYRVRRVADPDFDLVLTDGLGQQRAVLVRHFRKTVNESGVNRLAESAARLGKAAPMIVTVERFTYRAREAATARGVILWSLPDLARAIGQVKRAAAVYSDLPSRSREEALSVLGGQPEPGRDAGPLPEAEERSAVVPMSAARRRPGRSRRGARAPIPGEVPFCPRCGRKMMVMTNHSGEFWACPLFPRCLGSRQK